MRRAICMFALSIAVGGAGLASANDIVVAVVGYDRDDASWKAFSNHLAKSETWGLNVKFKHMSFSDLTVQLKKEKGVHAAIMAPYAYVLLAADDHDMELIARIQRGGTARANKKAEDPEAAKKTPEQRCIEALSPRSHYGSVLLAHNKQLTWPVYVKKGTEQKVDLLVSSRFSTSSFIFPANTLIENLSTNDLDMKNPHR
jgi:hypothetical protein